MMHIPGHFFVVLRKHLMKKKHLFGILLSISVNTPGNDASHWHVKRGRVSHQVAWGHHETVDNPRFTVCTVN